MNELYLDHMEPSPYRKGIAEIEKRYLIMESVAKLFKQKINNQDIDNLADEYTENYTEEELRDIVKDFFAASLKWIYSK